MIASEPRINLNSYRNNKSKLYTELVTSEFRVLFKDRDFFPLIRRKQLSNIDYLSYIGGLLGLFAGISVLSIMEIFYFGVIKVVLKIMAHRKRSRTYPVGRIEENSCAILGRAMKKLWTKIGFMKASSIHSVNIIVDADRSCFEM